MKFLTMLSQAIRPTMRHCFLLQATMLLTQVNFTAAGKETEFRKGVVEAITSCMDEEPNPPSGMSQIEKATTIRLAFCQSVPNQPARMPGAPASAEWQAAPLNYSPLSDTGGALVRLATCVEQRADVNILTNLNPDDFDGPAIQKEIKESLGCPAASKFYAGRIPQAVSLAALLERKRTPTTEEELNKLVAAVKICGSYYTTPPNVQPEYPLLIRYFYCPLKNGGPPFFEPDYPKGRQLVDYLNAFAKCIVGKTVTDTRVKLKYATQLIENPHYWSDTLVYNEATGPTTAHLEFEQVVEKLQRKVVCFSNGFGLNFSMRKFVAFLVQNKKTLGIKATKDE